MDENEIESVKCPCCGNEIAPIKYCTYCGAFVREPEHPQCEARFDAIRNFNRQTTNLDGTPVANADETPDRQFEPPPKSFAETQFEILNLEEAKRIKQLEKYNSEHPAYGPEGKRFFAKIAYLIIDTEAFFTQIRMEKELAGSIGFVTLVMIVNFSLMLLIFSVKNGFPEIIRHLSENLLLLCLPILIFAFILIVSIAGTIVMRFFYRSYINWRRLFGIYSYSTLPLALVWIPVILYGGDMLGMFLFCLILFPLLFLYIALCTIGFENVFGLEMAPARAYALGIPLVVIILLSPAFYFFFQHLK